MHPMLFKILAVVGTLFLERSFRLTEYVFSKQPVVYYIQGPPKTVNHYFYSQRAHPVVDSNSDFGPSMVMINRSDGIRAWPTNGDGIFTDLKGCTPQRRCHYTRDSTPQKKKTTPSTALALYTKPAQPPYDHDWVLIFLYVFFLASLFTIGLGFVRYRASLQHPVYRYYLSEPLIQRAHRVWALIHTRPPPNGKTFYVPDNTHLVLFPIYYAALDYDYRQAEMEKQQEHDEEVRTLRENIKFMQKKYCDKIQELNQKHEEEVQKRQLAHEKEMAEHEANIKREADGELLGATDKLTEARAINANLHADYWRNKTIWCNFDAQKRALEQERDTWKARYEESEKRSVQRWDKAEAEIEHAKKRYEIAEKILERSPETCEKAAKEAEEASLARIRAYKNHDGRAVNVVVAETLRSPRVVKARQEKKLKDFMEKHKKRKVVPQKWWEHWEEVWQPKNETTDFPSLAQPNRESSPEMDEGPGAKHWGSYESVG